MIGSRIFQRITVTGLLFVALIISTVATFPGSRNEEQEKRGKRLWPLIINNPENFGEDDGGLGYGREWLEEECNYGSKQLKGRRSWFSPSQVDDHNKYNNNNKSNEWKRDACNQTQFFAWIFLAISTSWGTNKCSWWWITGRWLTWSQVGTTDPNRLFLSWIFLFEWLA